MGEIPVCGRQASAGLKQRRRPPFAKSVRAGRMTMLVRLDALALGGRESDWLDVGTWRAWLQRPSSCVQRGRRRVFRRVAAGRGGGGPRRMGDVGAERAG